MKKLLVGLMLAVSCVACSNTESKVNDVPDWAISEREMALEYEAIKIATIVQNGYIKIADVYSKFGKNPSVFLGKIDDSANVIYNISMYEMKDNDLKELIRVLHQEMMETVEIMEELGIAY